MANSPVLGVALSPEIKEAIEEYARRKHMRLADVMRLGVLRLIGRTDLLETAKRGRPVKKQ